jgi:periplasmic protein CpxP/Spy
MTDENSNQGMEILPPAGKSSWRRMVLVSGAATLSLVGIGAYAYASNDNWGPRHKVMLGFMEYQMDLMLTEAGADAGQKVKLKALVTTTIDQIRPDHEARETMRDEIIKLIEAPTIDRTAIEALRAKQMAQFEERSKTIAKAVADAAEILTPEQRKKLVEEMKDFGPHGRW